VDSSYLWLKSLHLLGVVAFLGNIIITGWWKFMADRTRNSQVIAFAQRQVTLTDYVFTVGGAFIILVAGWGNAALHGMSVYQTNWLSWGLGLFSASGLIWLVILIPIQIRQEKWLRNLPSAATFRMSIGVCAGVGWYGA
jgi:uncharacterized membrane protein